MSDLIMQKLEEMQARCDAATEGPWRGHSFGLAGEDEPSSIVIHTGEFVWGDAYEGRFLFSTSGADSQEWDDADFIAASRTDMPRLIDALRATAELHRPETLGLLNPDCAEGACDHDPDDPENPSDCPVIETAVCAGCFDLAERVWPYYGEEGVEAVTYPCPTVKAFEEALGVEA